MSLFDLSDKVVVVTGSTKGIGKAIAARMAEAGAKVVVSSRKAEACDAVAAEINENFAQNGGEAVASGFAHGRTRVGGAWCACRQRSLGRREGLSWPRGVSPRQVVEVESVDYSGFCCEGPNCASTGPAGPQPLLRRHHRQGDHGAAHLRVLQADQLLPEPQALRQVALGPAARAPTAHLPMISP